MKLSMWILAERFSSYHIRYEISDGSADISGVRFFSEELSELSSDHVYVGKCSDVFSDPEYKDTILLVHGYDLMFIEDQSAEEVLNQVLSAFDYYNRWENSLWAAAGTEHPVQSMVDACDDIMNGPLAVSDSRGHIIACTHADGPHRYSEGWRFIYETGTVPNTYTSSPIKDVEGNILDDWTTYPQIFEMENHICIGSQIVADKEIVAAFYMQQFSKVFTQGDVQLAEVFCAILTSITALHGLHSEIQSNAALVGSLLDGEEVDASTHTKLDTLMTARAPYQLLIVRSVTSSINIVRRNTLFETVLTLVPDTLALTYENDIVCIVSYSSVGHFLQALSMQVNLTHYVIGVSLPFKGWEKLFSRYKQAQCSLNLATGTSKAVSGAVFFRDIALEYVMSTLHEYDVELDLAHPALAILSDYDKAHDTDFYNSLKQYLRNERNMVKTAEDLCIHRNSLKYRMRRIREMINADLDDPRERLFLLLSFSLKE